MAAVLVLLAGGVCSSVLAALPDGGFLAVMNDSRNNSDSPVSIMFFDVDDLTTPIFGVYVGGEYFSGGSTPWEETQAITVDPTTGDIYFNAFDSDSGGTGNIDPFGDTIGDMDLYRIPFSTIYQHWSTNFEGQNVRSLANPIGWGIEPGDLDDVPTANAGNPDYVLYGPRNDFSALQHANKYELAGSVEKIGEVLRGNGGDEDTTDGLPGPYWLDALEFISPTEMMLLGDSITAHSPVASQNPADDHSFRMLRRISQENGDATFHAVTNPNEGGTNYVDGGFNGGTGSTNSQGKPTESWESELIQFVNLDNPETGGHSEPESLAYYNNGAGGADNVRGVWVTERDMPMSGDQIAFLQIDENGDAIGYRQVEVTDPGDYAGVYSSLIMHNDPANSPNLGDFYGQIENIFVDDNGDLIIVESAFGDENNFIGGTETEPAVIRLSVTDYGDNNLNNVITLGDFGEKIFLNPVRDPSDPFDPDSVPNNGDELPKRGQWTAFDKENNIVYFVNPGNEGDDVPFGTDIFALDLDTGVTTTYTDVDDSYSLFLSDSYGDKVVFFNLTAPEGLLGDYNEDDVVNAADYTVWRNAVEAGATSLPNEDPSSSPGAVDQADYLYWRNHYGESLGSGAGGSPSVPEPGSLTLVLVGLVTLLASRRRSRC